MSRTFKILIDVDVKHLVAVSESQHGSQAGQDLFVVAMLGGSKNKTFLEIGAGDPDYMSNTYLLEKEFGFSGVAIDINDWHKESWPRKEKFKKFYKDIKDPSWPDVESIEQIPEHLQEECRTMFNYEFEVGHLAEHVPAGRNDWKNIRPLTQFYLADALEFDYSTLNSYYDYLQIDIDPCWNNWLVLEKLSVKEFAVITFEHDLWNNTLESKQAKQLGQTLLENLGYQLVADNVTIEPGKGQGIGDEPIYFEDWYANPKYIDQSVIDAYRFIGTGFPKYYHQILFRKD